MDLSKILLIAQVIIGVLLIASILIQSRGASLGEAWGGSSAFYSSRRGSERTLFIVTVVLAVLFVGIALFSLFI